MNNRKTVIRFFTIADYEDEEVWLHNQHKNGWKLSRMILHPSGGYPQPGGNLFDFHKSVPLSHSVVNAKSCMTFKRAFRGDAPECPSVSSNIHTRSRTPAPCFPLPQTSYPRGSRPAAEQISPGHRDLWP